MKSIHIPNESFQNHHDVLKINNLLNENANIIFELVDDYTEIWILGNKDEDFFRDEINEAFTKKKVLDPIDNMPIGNYDDIKQLVIIYHKYWDNSKLNKEVVYANCGIDLLDFTEAVINLLPNLYPKRQFTLKN